MKVPLMRTLQRFHRTPILSKTAPKSPTVSRPEASGYRERGLAE